MGAIMSRDLKSVSSRVQLFLFAAVLYSGIFLGVKYSHAAGEQRNIIPEDTVYIAVESHEFREALIKGLGDRAVSNAFFALAETRAKLFCIYHSFDDVASFTLGYRNTDSFKLGTAFEFEWMLTYEPVTRYPRASLDLSELSKRSQGSGDIKQMVSLIGDTTASEKTPQVPHLVFTELMCSKK